MIITMRDLVLILSCFSWLDHFSEFPETLRDGLSMLMLCLVLLESQLNGRHA